MESKGISLFATGSQCLESLSLQVLGFPAVEIKSVGEFISDEFDRSHYVTDLVVNRAIDIRVSRDAHCGVSLFFSSSSSLFPLHIQVSICDPQAGTFWSCLFVADVRCIMASVFSGR